MLNSRLADIDENLVRDDLTVLEQATWLRERKATYLELYPETRAGISQSAGMNNSLGNNVSEDNSLTSNPTFTDSTAQKTSQSKCTIEQNIQIATELAEYIEDMWCCYFQR